MNPAVHPGAYDGPWSGPLIETYATLGDDDPLVEAAVGPDGMLHMLVVRGGVAYHAIPATTGMASEILLGGGVTSGDISVSGDGVVHVALANAAGAVGYRRKEGAGDWVGEVIDADMYDGDVVAMALDATGEPHVVYDSRGALRYAARSAGTWSAETIAMTSCAGCRPSIGFDSMGGAHVVYATADGGTELVHAQGGAGAWSTDTLAMLTEAGGVDVAIGSDDVLHVVAAATRAGGPQPVTYARVSTSETTVQGLGDVGVTATGARIVLGTDGSAAIVYTADGRITFATTDGVADPMEETVDQGAASASAAIDLVGGAPSIAALTRTGMNGTLSILTRVGMDGVDENCDGTDGT